jgi:putative oxidoreductase
MKIGRLILRLVVGGLFVGHGTQKLFGWFGGNGLDATAQGFEHLGLRPGRQNAIAAGAAEAGGGALLAAGLATPLASSVLIATMLTAIHRVHAKNGPWAGDGGYEYNLVLIAAALALAEVGPGALPRTAATPTSGSRSRWTGPRDANAPAPAGRWPRSPPEPRVPTAPTRLPRRNPHRPWRRAPSRQATRERMRATARPRAPSRPSRR